jgi:heptosyltransferase-2
MKERIAFRTPNWLGDAVMATVVPPALRRAHADAHVSVLTPAALVDLFKHDPDVDEVAGFVPGGEVDAYRRGRYDRVLLAPVSFGSAWRAWRGGSGRRFGFGGSLRNWLLADRLPGDAYRRDRHQVENYRELAALLGEPRTDDAPRVVTGAAERAAAEELWPSSGAARVVLQPGATYGPAKRWAAARFAEVAHALRADGADVAVVGGPGDRESVAEVVSRVGGILDLGGRTTVGQLAAVLEGANLVITNDSGPMHLAAAVGTKTVAVFGSTSPTWTRPFGEGHRVLTHPVPCAPCFQRDCDIGYLCLEGVSAAAVLEAARSALSGR